MLDDFCYQSENRPPQEEFGRSTEQMCVGKGEQNQGGVWQTISSINIPFHSPLPNLVVGRHSFHHLRQVWLKNSPMRELLTPWTYMTDGVIIKGSQVIDLDERTYHW